MSGDFHRKPFHQSWLMFFWKVLRKNLEFGRVKSVFAQALLKQKPLKLPEQFCIVCLLFDMNTISEMSEKKFI